MKRKDGYYWVKREGTWYVAEWDNYTELFRFAWDIDCTSEEHEVEIDEDRLLSPDERQRIII